MGRKEDRIASDLEKIAQLIREGKVRIPHFEYAEELCVDPSLIEAKVKLKVIGLKRRFRDG